jgi:osmoprotectant transport system permease protein
VLPVSSRTASASPDESAPYAWLAVLASAAAFAVPVYELRPNRIASGTAAWLWQVPSLAFPLILAFVMLVACLTERRIAVRWGVKVRASQYALPPLLLLIQVLVLLSPGLFLAGPDRLALSPSYRVSPAAGFWAIQAVVVLGLAWAAAAGNWWTRKSAARFGLIFLGLGLVLVGWNAGLLEVFSPWKELRAQGPRFGAELWRHLYLSGVSFGAALLLGIAGAVASSRNRRVETLVAGLAASVQNIPSLALFGLLLPVLAGLSSTFPALRSLGISGIGAAPAILALTAYGILPIVLATLAGLRMVDAGAKDAARGMGMRPAQILFKVELPLALPSIAGGARTALVQTIGTTTVAALVGAGGMGYFIFQGVGQAAMDMVVLGVIPVVLMSLLADRGMAALTGLLARKGGRQWP